MASDLGVPLPDRSSATTASSSASKLEQYVGDDVGLPTLQDILAELKKPGRDPREAFEPPAFRSDVTEPKHLTEGMELEGVVTNIVAFGAFVDVGVHQDGLVHVSQLADRYVSDPNAVVSVGQKVRVRVVSVDLQRNRIALTMKSGAAEPRRADRTGRAPRSERPERAARPPVPAPAPARTPKPGDVAPNGMRFR